MDIRLILSGGFGTLKLEEVNRSLYGWAEWQKEKAIFRENWDYIGEEVRKLNTGFDFGGEIAVFFTSRIAVGFGAEFIYGELVEKNIELFVEMDSKSYALTRPAKASAIPLILSAYYYYPLNKKLDLFLKAGGGLIWAKYIERAGNRRLEEEYFNYLKEELIIASSRGSIFVGGLGLSYRIDPSLSLFIQGEARLAKTSGFQGKMPEGELGELYYFEEYSPDIDFWRATFKMYAEAPSGEDFRSVRKAVVDFSGFSAKMGLLIKF